MRMFNPISTEWSRRALTPARRADVFEDFDGIVNSFLRPTFAATVNFQPSCDVNETKDHYLVSFDMPGVKKEDIQIEVKANELRVSGERTREVKEDSGESTLHHERMYGRFERVFTLPTTVATDKIEAQYENGVLNIAIPKAETAKARTIQIQNGQEGFLNKLLGSKKEPNKESKDARTS